MLSKPVPSGRARSCRTVHLRSHWEHARMRVQRNRQILRVYAASQTPPRSSAETYTPSCHSYLRARCNQLLFFRVNENRRREWHPRHWRNSSSSHTFARRNIPRERTRWPPLEDYYRRRLRKRPLLFLTRARDARCAFLFLSTTNS